MSRAFIKEDAGGDDIVVTHRPPLPTGSPNHVTARGLALLQAELAERNERLAALQLAEQTPAVTRQLTAESEERELLLDRLATAAVVARPSGNDPPAAIGATATICYLNGPQQGRTVQLTIVGVDEADPLAGLVAFTAPVAQALLGAKPGQTVSFSADSSEIAVRLEAVSYDNYA